MEPSLNNSSELIILEELVGGGNSIECHCFLTAQVLPGSSLEVELLWP